MSIQEHLFIVLLIQKSLRLWHCVFFKGFLKERIQKHTSLMTNPRKSIATIIMNRHNPWRKILYQLYQILSRATIIRNQTVSNCYRFSTATTIRNQIINTFSKHTRSKVVLASKFPAQQDILSKCLKIWTLTSQNIQPVKQQLACCRKHSENEDCSCHVFAAHILGSITPCWVVIYAIHVRPSRPPSLLRTELNKATVTEGRRCSCWAQ